jgi:hypothetical protein
VSSRIAQVVLDAAGEIEATGHVAHLYTSCERAGSINATTKDPPCTACLLIQIATDVAASQQASRA